MLKSLIQAPVPAQVIDMGIPTAGLLAHVMIAKFADHLPPYRQESIFGRAGLAIARSTLAQWVGKRAGDHEFNPVGAAEWA
ncbi:transposase [Pseudomonas sp. GGS8]|nr:transposase [Pseudomonas sp. GGS8]